MQQQQQPPTAKLHGLLQACKAMSALGRPLYITETGVADKEDRNREVMMDTYFAQVCFSASESRRGSPAPQSRAAAPHPAARRGVQAHLPGHLLLKARGDLASCCV